ncbi:glycoside hydrolase family 2 protein [Marinomonas agarivorans]|nr:glycoside hydrolase family 2 protein [Marinomonas agarivorans]
MSSRTQISFNDDWSFQLTSHNASEPEAWRSIHLPHDWSIEQSFSENWNGATGYLPGGQGHYRKHFAHPALSNSANKKVYLLFDGIYNHAKVYLNGHLLTYHVSGYAPFYLDVTDKLEETNEIDITIDRSRYIDSRWYTGSGIYRNVDLIITNKTHIGVWGSVVNTPIVTENSAQLEHELEIHSDYESYPQTILLDIFYQAEGTLSDSHHLAQTVQLTGKIHKEMLSSELGNPKLWSIDSPTLYKAKVCIHQDKEKLDEHQINFGIRTFKFHNQNGFSLNNVNMKIKGVCLHHDGGLVGAAVPKQVWRRRLSKLKECGVNAIRIAHNPAANELLDLCDEMGFLVQDEFFDEWDYPKDKRLNMGDTHGDYLSDGYASNFQTDAKKDLVTTIKSHRHHPCIFMWSIGNEIEWTYPRNAEATGFFDAKWDGNYFWSLPPNSPDEIAHNLATLPKPEYDIGATAQKLSRWVKEIDTSRPVTANCILPSASYLSGYADALDVIGFSYRRVVYDYGHQHYPHLPIIGNENLPQWHEWKAVLERPHVAGLFLWTGINYMGESHKKWPIRTTDSGLLDAAGFTNTSFYMFQSLWREEPVLHLVTQKASSTDLVIDQQQMTAKEQDPDGWQTKLWVWPERNQHWNYDDGEWIVVEAFSNCDEVALLLNDKPIASQYLVEQQDRIFRWAVPYQTGRLVAIGKQSGKEVSQTELQTAGTPTQIQLTCEGEATEGNIRHLILQVTDALGVPVQQDEFTIEISLDNALLLGVDNGSVANVQPHISNKITTHKGRALAIIQLDSSGNASCTFTAQTTQENITSAKIQVS